MNLVIISGNLCADVELKSFESGSTVGKMRIATSEWNGKERISEYHSCVVWNDDAKRAAQHLKKGDGVVLYGRIASRSWENDAGEKRSASEIKVNRWEFSPGKKNGASHDAQQATYEPRGAAPRRDAPPARR